MLLGSISNSSAMLCTDYNIGDMDEYFEENVLIYFFL